MMDDDIKLPGTQEMEDILAGTSILSSFPDLTSSIDNADLPQTDGNRVSTQEIINFQLDYEEREERQFTGSVRPGRIETTFSSGAPSFEDYPGAFNFTMNPSTTHTSSVYSILLKKLFIDMNKVMIVEFSLSCFIPGLYIRAVPVYSQNDFVSEPVKRCPIHSAGDDPQHQAHIGSQCDCHLYNQVGHVLRVQESNAIYCYNEQSLRHSVMVPVISLEQPDNFLRVPFSFACKSSCHLGMSRRPINIVFTLEDEMNQVIGRRVLSVKICSCPKRDMGRSEKYHLSENGLEDSIVSPSGKKRKIPLMDSNEDIKPKIKQCPTKPSFKMIITPPSTPNQTGILQQLEEVIQDVANIKQLVKQEMASIEVKLNKIVNSVYNTQNK